MTNIMNTIKTFHKTYYFKLIFLILLLSSFLSLACFSKRFGFVQGLIDVYSNPYFLIVPVLLFSANIIFLNKQLYKETHFIIRNKDINAYISSVNKKTFIINFYCYLLLFLFTLFVVFFRVENKFILEVCDYGFLKIFYFLFYFIRSYIILYFISIIIFYFLLIGKNNLIYMYLGVLITLMITYPYSIEPITTIGDFKVYFGYYLTQISYQSFSLELLCTFGILTILYSIVIIVRNTYINLMRGYHV